MSSPARRKRSRRRRSYARYTSLKRARLALSVATLTVSSALAAFAWQTRDPFEGLIAQDDQAGQLPNLSHTPGTPTAYGRTRIVPDALESPDVPKPAAPRAGADEDAALTAQGDDADSKKDAKHGSATDESGASNQAGGHSPSGSSFQGLFAGFPGRGMWFPGGASAAPRSTMASRSGGSSSVVDADALSSERGDNGGVADGSNEGTTEGTDGNAGGSNPTGGQPVIDGRRPGGASLPAFGPAEEDGDGLSAFPSELRATTGDTSSPSTTGDSSTHSDQPGDGNQAQGGGPAGTDTGAGGPTGAAGPDTSGDTPLFPSEFPPPTQLRVDNDQPPREPVRSVPEPASLVLGATAAAGFALRARRRRRLA